MNIGKYWTPIIVVTKKTDKNVKEIAKLKFEIILKFEFQLKFFIDLSSSLYVAAHNIFIKTFSL